MTKRKAATFEPTGNPIEWTLRQAPLGILMGEVGVGKSTMLAHAACQGWYFLLTNPTALAPWAEWLLNNRKEAKAKGLKFPKFGVWSPYDFDNPEASADVWDRFRAFILKWAKAKHAGTNPFRGLVIDEASTLLEWIDEEIKSRLTKNKFEAINREKRELAWLIHTMRNSGSGLVLNMHMKPIVYEEVEKKDHPLYGEVRHPAGPAMPIGTMIRKTVRELDFCWEIGVGDDASERVLRTQPEENIIRKSRRWGLDEEITLTPENTLADTFRRVGLTF